MHVHACGYARLSKWIAIINIRNPKGKKKMSAAEKAIYSQLPNICYKGVNNHTNDELRTPSL